LAGIKPFQEADDEFTGAGFSLAGDSFVVEVVAAFALFVDSVSAAWEETEEVNSSRNSREHRSRGEMMAPLLG